MTNTTFTTSAATTTNTKSIPPNTARRNNGSSLTMFIASYKYHVVYCSLYVVIAVRSWKAATDLFQQQYDHNRNDATTADTADISTITNSSSSSTTMWMMIAFYYFLVGLAFLALQSEVNYMVMRRSLPPGDSGPAPIVGSFFNAIANPESFFCRDKPNGLPLPTRCTRSESFIFPSWL